MRGIIGLAVVVALAFATDHWFGAIGVTRLFGLLVLGACVYACFAPSFTIAAGNTEIAKLTGWKKVAALVPLGAVGLALVLYAPAVTCISSKYKHLCA
ncbi:hypothetical protein [Pelomonas sp. SE-A7]|uniref:hypothetical protein n=1 Tax=Pelomonas sp. SE-A7 TaxID=3054953 RepID=UPI00259C8920|nr:hypothetical protein [Pelomonas sp. SE-A7]MDM4767193.1 hypothetical protein [Pelomonas sp. SE-A7]MDM4767197.1 hypothetical protein [Pelomonas sp. SE-A7]